MVEMWHNERVNHIKSSGTLTRRRCLFSIRDRSANTMSHSIPNTTEQSNIPYGYCHCGCGQKTTLAPQNHTARGWRKGEPVRWIPGHNPTPIPKNIHPPIAERFWVKVDRRSKDRCWNWQAATNPAGYGVFHSDIGSLAHRYSWTLHFGPIPDGLFVCHACDNPACVNPYHLFLGTHKDNMRDMDEKDRRITPDRTGRFNGHSKLTENDVHEIRRRYKMGESQSALGKEFGVSQSHVSAIILCARWSHV